jgi:hypothetical protein
MQFIRAGRVILLRDDVPGIKAKAWIVLTDPRGQPARVVAVMLETARGLSDTTVILVPGEHEFVRHATAIVYWTAQFFTIPQFQRAWRRADFKLMADLSPAMLAKVRAGVLASPHTRHEVRAYWELEEAGE